MSETIRKRCLFKTFDLQFCLLESVKKNPVRLTISMTMLAFINFTTTFSYIKMLHIFHATTVVHRNEGHIKSALSSVTFPVPCQVRAGLVYLSAERALLRTAFDICLRSVLLNAICSKPGPDYVPRT